ncbi:uncharacterized protein [Gossypium hirsutum]|uniref:Uncharacterized protein isoform X5 n=1 Tax=Gossypium hirsutum TaxID=3635 RepID=A0ABM2Z8R5_GOSHI|nr:uncharacterized protein LOC107934732 isoform X5 [Gossypium hirsutum]
MKFLFRFISGINIRSSWGDTLAPCSKKRPSKYNVARVKGNVNVVKAIEDYIVYSLVGCGSFTGQDLLKCLFLSCFQEKFGWLFYQLVPEIIQNLSSWSWPYILLCRYPKMLKHLKMSKAVMMQNKILKK